MFLGEYTHNFDDKGRLTLPAKFREGLETGVVVTRGIDPCLLVFTRTGFDNMAQNIVTLPITGRNNRDFSRLMFSGAADLIPDRQGRILIPQVLRDYAGLDGEAIIIGLYDKLEIWNLDRWNGVKTQVESDPESIAEQLNDLNQTGHGVSG